MGNGEIQVSGNLKIARNQAELIQIIREEPETETWLNQEYTE